MCISYWLIISVSIAFAIASTSRLVDTMRGISVPFVDLQNKLFDLVQ